MDFQQLKEAITSYYPNPDLDLLERAYNFAFNAHKDQVRASGDPYFIHVFETALLACDIKLDVDSVASALLHDVIEDCGVKEDELIREFNPEIAGIVQGVSKLTNIRFDSKEAKQAENFRKMLIAMAQDIRVVLVKICDRLHNMRTLDFLPDRKRERIAQETQEIYAPIAHRLGLYVVKSELEDLCFKNLRPKLYDQIDQQFESSKTEQQKLIDQTVTAIKDILKKSGVSGQVSGRSKHYYSIWQKMERQSINFDEINDLLAFRVIVPSLRACYETLGIVHAAWKPVPGLFKDYIAMPKTNMYQSLHTTVIGPDGQRIEIQIRTLEMHRIAEEGVAAHWRYKEGDKSTEVDLKWIKELVDSQSYLSSPDDFLQSVKSELFPDEIFIFTPDGDLIRLPYSACPIDFAYYVHTDLGNTISGAKVNGQMVSLSSQLNNGDTVEIITSKSQTPKRDWLSYVKSNKARQKIRSFLKSEERAKSMSLGMDLLTKELRKYDLTLKKAAKGGELDRLLRSYDFKNEGDLHAEIGYGKLKPRDVVKKMYPNLDLEKTEAQVKSGGGALSKILKKAVSANKKSRSAIKVAGMDDILIRYARCCTPLAGDRIVGYITRGRGISVHRRDCRQVLNYDPSRLVDVEWADEVDKETKVKIKLLTVNRMGLLAEVTNAVAQLDADIIYSETTVQQETNKASIIFEMLLKSSDQLDQIRRSIEMVPGVIKVERVAGKS